MHRDASSGICIANFDISYSGPVLADQDSRIEEKIRLKHVILRRKHPNFYFVIANCVCAHSSIFQSSSSTRLANRSIAWERTFLPVKPSTTTIPNTPRISLYLRRPTSLSNSWNKQTWSKRIDEQSIMPGGAQGIRISRLKQMELLSLKTI